MPINASPHFERAQVEYEQAQTTEEKIKLLKKMIVLAPKHKSSENLLANLKTRLKKLKQDAEKKKRSGKSSFKGIKKEDMQALIIGKTNSGKSSLLKVLTNANPRISKNKFTTIESTIGMMNYLGTAVQLIEIPAIEGEHFNKNLTHTTDTILILIDNLKDLKFIEDKLPKTKAKRIIVFNKRDLLSSQEKRKVSANLQSKKYNFMLISSIKEIQDNNLLELKKKIFNSFDIIRVFTKEPKKEKSKKPMIMKPNATIKDVIEKILKSLSRKVTETKIWGPSSKFGGQKVGLQHKLKDLDVIEFKTR